MYLIEVEILSTPGCVSRTAAKKTLENLVEKQKDQFPDLHWKDVDLTENDDYIMKYRVTSTPVVVVNGKVEFRGLPKEDELIATLEKYK